MNAEAYLGLGANLGQPAQTFKSALQRISGFAEILGTSSLYRSEPFGFADQPPFTNAAAKISTDLSPPALLKELQTVEKDLGKKVIRENGPRVIDLDLLLCGDISLQSDELVLPHPGILMRDFVLLPLMELNPDLSHPQWGPQTLKSALGGLQKRFIGEGPGNRSDWT